MTTIAWDGEKLAADKAMTWGGTQVSSTKIHTLKHPRWVMFGTAGDGFLCAKFTEYLKGRIEQFDCTNENIGILCIDKDGQPWMLNKEFVPLEVDTPWAIGTGSDYALGAMAMGADAELAVEIAMMYDNLSGLGVDVLEFK